MKIPEKIPTSIAADATAPSESASRTLSMRLGREDLQRLLLSLLDNIPGMVYRGRPDWGISFAGAEVERITGYSVVEASAEGFQWRRLIHPDDFEEVRGSIRFAVRRRDPILRMEYRIIRKDGQVRWISDRRQLVYGEDGRLEHVDGLVLDIMERKRAEEERRRLATAVEQAADAIIVTDSDWVIRYANPAFEKIMGYGREEVLGKTPMMFSAGDRDDRAFQGIAAKAKSGEFWKGRLTNRRKDGTLLTGDTAISPVRDAEGKIVNYVIAKRDITREVVLEKQVQTAQRMEAVGTLAGGIAHDFNNALTGIIGFAELLRLRIPADPKVQGDIDEILLCAERASTLTKQLLAFARRQVIEPVILNVNTVVRDLSRLMKKVSGEQIEVCAQLTEGIPSIVADRGQIEQVLMNLCLNARDAMPRGGRFILSTAVMTPSEDFLRRNPFMPPGVYVGLEVSDTGCGMDEVTRERAFEPYFTTKSPEKGTGLGLSMVYGIVKQSRGFIFLESRPGEGTTFRIFFPAVEAAPDEKGGEEKPAVVRGGKETILLAEDEEAIRLLAVRSLSDQGYTVLAAADGMEAVQLAHGHPEISMAILDVMMPRMGGKDAFDAILRFRPGIPALFTSGYSTDQIHDSFVLLPGIEFLPKPYSPATLAGRVRDVLDGVRRTAGRTPPAP